MALFPTNATQVQAFATALYGIQVGSTTMAQVTSDIQSYGGLNNALNAYYSVSFGTATNDSVAKTIAANIGFGTDANAVAYITALLNTAAPAARGAAVIAMLDNFLSTTTGANAAIAATFNATVAHAVAYTGTSDVASGSTTIVQGSAFTLTTNVDAFSGGAGDDTFSGLVGVSGTYTVGDNIIGGAGDDTLNLIFSSGDSAGGIVGLRTIETVNSRLLGTAATAVTLNATDWVGVTTLTNASSLADSILQVSGLATTTKVVLNGNTDINVGYSNTTTASNAVSIVLNNAGDFGATGAHTLAGTGMNTANIDLDLANAGLISSVSVEIQGGANVARLEGGSSVTGYTLTGAGSAVLVTDDLISNFDASAMLGGVDITFEGASTIAVKGGAGNDTINFVTGAYVSTDTIVGGAGIDTLSLRVGAFNRTVTTSQVEKVTLQYNENGGGSISVSGSDASTINLQPSAAGAAISVTDVISGATVNLQRAASASIDFQSGTTTSTINVGSAGTGFSADALTITDGGAITINSIAGSAGKSNGVSSISLDANAKSLAINTSGTEADLTVNNMAIGGISALTITSQGSAGFTLTSGISGTSLASVLVNAAGNNAGDVTLAAIQDSTGLNTVTLNASSGADIYGASFEFGNGASGTNANVTLSANAGNGDEVGTASADQAGIAITTTGWATLNINANASASGNVHIGTIAMATGAATGTGAINIINVSATVDVNAVVRTEAIDLSGAWTGQQVNLSNLSVGQSGTFVFASGGINLGTIENSKVTIGSITVATAAAATIGTVIATGASGTDVISYGAITVAQSGFASIGAIAATAGRVGAITVNLNGDASTFTAAAVTASAIGAVTITIAADDDAHLAALAATAGTLGYVQVNVAASGSAVFASLGASSIGSIAVSGAGFASIGTITANKVGTVSQTGSGTFSIDLSGVSAGVEVNLGLGTANSVISGKGNDVITLLAGQTGKSGNDTILFKASGQGTDNIINFIGGARASGGDVIGINSSGFSVIGALTADAASDFITVSATATMTAADNIVVLVSAFATTAGMLSAVGSGGANQITLAATGVTGQSLMIVWSDGTDSYVSLLSLNGTGASGVVLSTTGTNSLETLAVISGVSPGALVAANFDFV